MCSCTIMNNDIGIVNHGVAIVGGKGEEVTAWVTLHTNQEPQSFTMWAILEHKVAGSWVREERKIIHKDDLAPVGEEKTFTIRTECKRGSWRMVAHFFGTTHGGTNEYKIFYFPDKRGQYTRCRG